MIRIFAGYDRRFPALYYVLSHSIHKRASQPIAMTPLNLTNLASLYQREHNPLQSTEFSFSRFFAPYLCNFEGWSLFMDNDVIVLDDIAALWAMRDEKYAIQVVKHDHQPIEGTKFLGEKQTVYEKKNWSSVILFNNAKCKALTPEYVNSASGLELHQFKWLESENLIGEIPHQWNHLVGYDAPNKDAALVHYTLGGPYFDATRDCEFAEQWFAERESMLTVAQAS